VKKKRNRWAGGKGVRYVDLKGLEKQSRGKACTWGGEKKVYSSYRRLLEQIEAQESWV